VGRALAPSVEGRGLDSPVEDWKNGTCCIPG